MPFRFHLWSMPGQDSDCLWEMKYPSSSIFFFSFSAWHLNYLNGFNKVAGLHSIDAIQYLSKVWSSEVFKHVGTDIHLLLRRSIHFFSNIPRHHTGWQQTQVIIWLTLKVKVKDSFKYVYHDSVHHSDSESSQYVTPDVLIGFSYNFGNPHATHSFPTSD